MSQQLAFHDKISLAEAKDQRKQAELDAQLLANRIALLRQEDVKARKRVEQLLQKTRVLDEVRQRERQRQQEREKQQAEKIRRVQEVQRANAEQRERDRQARQEARRKQEQARREDVLRVKREHAAAEEQRRQYEEEQQVYNMQRSEQIRNQQRMLREKRLLDQKKRLEQTHYNYDRRVAEEEKKRQQFEAMVAQLEKEEIELIARLQVTQAQQRSVCQQLDAALNSSPRQPSREKVPCCTRPRSKELSAPPRTTGGRAQQRSSEQIHVDASG